MTKNNLIFLVLFFMAAMAYGQERTLVKGKVYTGNYGVSDVLVVNFSAEAETRTDSLGNFTIKARTGDLLICSDYKIATRKIRYTPDLVKDNVVLLEVKATAAELDEVVINKYDFSAYKMGLTETDIILPTVAERRLRSSGGGPVAMLINAITGQDKILKNALKIEKREMALEKISLMFDDALYTNDLKLHKDQVEGFKYFIVEDEKFRKMLALGDEGAIKFAMADLARIYLKLNSDEK
jgi:hypothetical protein